MNYRYILALLLISISFASAQKILIPMDLAQTNHLKAYGITYWHIKEGFTSDWLLNYRGGSFLSDYSDKLAAECRIRGVFFETISDSKANEILEEVKNEDVNMDVVKLEKAPKIAVYAPPGSHPWDDAVRLALDYAEVDHDIIYDEKIINDALDDYDWLHLHHEDFTGQYGKFWFNYQNQPWYIQMVSLSESLAQKLGYSKVSQLKLDVAKKIKSYVSDGGFMFAMCSATDTYDIALAAEGLDICDTPFDGDPYDPSANDRLDYSQTFAFEEFSLIMDPRIYEHSNIDMGPKGMPNPVGDDFTLFDFSAKYDPVPTMLTQNHVNVVHGFLGQATAFKESLIKNYVRILAKKDGTEEVKYLHGNFGRGTFTYYAGHDPEDYAHRIGDPPTDLELHKNSPGYRLILNNILFPAAKKKKQKT
jgi:hypothetical protein